MVRIDDALLQRTTATRFLRDLTDAAGVTPVAPEPVEADWGHRPDAELRRFLATLADDSLGAAAFAHDALPAGRNAWEWMVDQAHSDGDLAGAATAALHGALPIGRLPRAGGRLHLSVLLEDRWGLRAGRVLAHGPATQGAVARIEKRLGTFLLRLAQDAAAGEHRYGAEPLDAWHTRSAWIGQLLEGGGPPDHLDDAQLLQLVPALEGPALEALLAGGTTERLTLAWRAWLLAEDAVLDAALAAMDDRVRLERDAAALLADLRAQDADRIGPLTGLRGLRAALQRRLTPLRTATDPPHPAARIEATLPAVVDDDAPDDAADDAPEDLPPAPTAADPTALPEPAGLPAPPADDPFTSAPTETGASSHDEGETTDLADEAETFDLPGPGRRPGDPIPGPPPGGWPTHRDTYRSATSAGARAGVVLAVTAVAIGLLALCCGGLS